MQCLNCKKEFIPVRKNQKQCSRKCTQEIFHKRHPEKHREYTQKWYYKKPLFCHYCKKEIPISMRKAGLRFCSNKCRKCQKKLNQHKYLQKKKESVEKYKLQRGCQRCGYKVCAAALDFHHKNPKIKKTSLNQAHWSPTSKKVRIELKKCILLCKNCHYEIHNGIPFNANALEKVR